MEIQRKGNQHLEIVLDAPTADGLKQEIEALVRVVPNWKVKCKTAESCSVSLLTPPGEANGLAALAESTVDGLEEVCGLNVELRCLERAGGEPEPVSGDIASKKSQLKDLISLATVDGQFDPEEENTILEVGAHLGLSERQIHSIYNEAVLNPDQIESVPPQEPREKLEHLANLCRVILADGRIDDWETVLMVPLAAKMGFDSGDVARMLEELESGDSTSAG